MNDLEWYKITWMLFGLLTGVFLGIVIGYRSNE